MKEDTKHNYYAMKHLVKILYITGTYTEVTVIIINGEKWHC